MSKPVIPVPVPHHPAGEFYMTPFDTERYEIILVDTEKFMKDWQAQEERLLGPGHLDNKIFHSEPGLCAKYMVSDPSAPYEMGYLTFHPDENKKICFVNGRHRTCNLAKLGAPFLPVCVEKPKGLDEFRRKYEWHDYHTMPARRPQSGLSTDNDELSFNV